MMCGPVFLCFFVGGFLFAQCTELPEDPAQIRQSAVQHYNKGEKQQHCDFSHLSFIKACDLCVLSWRQAPPLRP